nr:hypothetical protein [Tanacetum cinerariifolium]
MEGPPSSNHVFNFPKVEFEEDPLEEPEEEFEEDPKEDPEEDPEEELEAEAEDNVPPPATPPALEMPPIGSTYEVGGPLTVTLFPPFYLHGREIVRLDDNTELLHSNVQYLERCEKKCKTDMEASSSEICKVKKRMDEMGQDLGDEMHFSNLKKAFFNLQAWVSKRLGWGALDARPDIGDDGPISFGESKPLKLPGSPSSSQ